MTAVGLADVSELVNAYAEAYVGEVDLILIGEDCLPMTTDQREVVREEFAAASLGMLRQLAGVVAEGDDLGMFLREFDDDNDITTRRHNDDGPENTQNQDR